MNFLQLHERLRMELVRRIDRGLITAASLARQSGLQQPHISNFLHSRRRLSLAALDRVLAALALSVEDLLPTAVTPQAARPPTPSDSVPLVSQAAALHDASFPTNAWPDRLQLPTGSLRDLPRRQAARARDWERFVAVGLTPGQARPMEPLLAPNNIVIIDRHYNALVPVHPPQPNIYAVRLENTLLFRYVEFAAARLILRPHSAEIPIQLVELDPQLSPSDLILGRLCFTLASL
jgi:transcriptional regulator with XRE-family HTH domain